MTRIVFLSETQAMKRLVLCLVAGLLAAPGCGSHRQGVRPDSSAVEPAANDEKKPQRVINGESPTVENWSRGDK